MRILITSLMAFLASFSLSFAQFTPSSGDIEDMIAQNPSLLDAVASKYSSQKAPEATDSLVMSSGDVMILDSTYQFNPLDSLSPLQRAMVESGGFLDSIKLDSLMNDSIFMGELYADTALWNKFVLPPLDSAALDSIAIEDAKEFPHSKIYGRSYFKEFSPEELKAGKIPSDYVIQEGDQVLFRLWGSVNHEQVISVGADGFAFLEPFNKQVYLKGMTYRSLRNFMSRTLKDMAGVQGEMRIIATSTISVRISGAAASIGAFPIPPYYTLWQALVMSSGPNDFGSVRDIELIRGGKVIQTFDLYKFLHKGKMKERGLQSGDIIHFNNLGPVVKIENGVRNPGIFESKINEKLSELIEYAGGLEDPEQAFSLSVERTIALKDIEKKGASREVVDLDLRKNSWIKFKLQNHDRLRFMGKAVRLGNHAWVSGDGVRLPGLYSIEDGKTSLWDLIEKAGGLREHAQPDIEVVRNKEGIRNAFTLVNDESSLKSFILSYGDSVLTWHQNALANRDSIEVLGNVELPGKIFWTKNMSLAAAIQRSGGALDGSMARMVVIRTTESGRGEYIAVGPEKKLLSKLEVSQKDFLRSTLLEKNDRVVVVNKKLHQNSPPVVVLYPGQEATLLPYSTELNLGLIMSHIPEFSYQVDSSRVEISNPDFEKAENFVKPQFFSITSENLNNNSLIQPGAMVTFKLDPKKGAPEFVTLIGEVAAPGSYSVLGIGESVQSIVNRAGGLTVRGNIFGVSIKRDSLDLSAIPVRTVKSEDKWKLDSHTKAHGGDTIFVTQNNHSVSIEGAVLSPGMSTFNPDWNWEDYVNLGGGGVLDTADIEKVYIIYPNGQSLKADPGWFTGGPEIVSGSKVIVPFKAYIEPSEDDEFDYKEFVQGITIALSAMVAVITIMQRSGQL